MVDIFDSTVSSKPQPGWVCVISIFMIIAQWVVAAIPWIKYNNYTIFMITSIGSVFALLSAGLPQWKAEKWSAARVTGRPKQVLLTRGNGHQYAMPVRCKARAWGLETMATRRPVYCQGTRWCLWLLAAFWITLFFTTLGIKHDTWYLVGVGIMGMVQNTIVAAYPCTPEELDLGLTPDEKCPTIVGFQPTHKVKEAYRKHAFDKDRDMRKADYPDTEVRDAMAAIMELGKRTPEPGKALLPIFFPDRKQALLDSERQF